MTTCLRRAPWMAVLALSLMLPARASDEAPGPASLALPGGPALIEGAPQLAGLGGELEVVLRLADVPLAVANGPEAKQRGGRLTPAQQRAYVRGLARKQDALMRQVRALGGRELGRTSKALNAVAVAIDASRLPDLAALPGVVSVRPVIDYEKALDTTVPYVGAADAHAAGLDGEGVRVAVLDSGIDYTHARFGGPGTAAAYEAAYGTSVDDARNTSLDDLFPTAKVVGGFDFVGELWPMPDPACGTDAEGNPLVCRQPDPDPIDCGPAAIGPPCAGGHGTHVADILAGDDGAGSRGVAPAARLYAAKVCSAVASSCSGVALLQAMDFALDPDGDGDMSDAVDVINMSLGASYGQREDDLSEASANAARAGVVVVAAAGNSADRPYIVASPSVAREVVSVAQTHVPLAVRIALLINSPASIAGVHPNTETVSWAPIGAGFTGDVAFVGRGCPADSPAPVPEGGDPYLADPAGKVALIDRGACNISLKVDRAAKAGAIGVLLGLVAPGDPISFSFGGGDTFVPTLVITQATANLIKANLAAPVNVTVSPAVSTPLVRSMVGSSSRGPSLGSSAIKPDIGAPGASVSAEAGTGTGATGFGGTSGATPMVAGAAALLVQAYPGRTPAEIKALLANTAETQITINPVTLPGVLAPVTRIGGGELRVGPALQSTTAAWDAEDGTPSLSFGDHALTGSQTFHKMVVVRNYGTTPRTYAVTPTFRDAGDQASGAVQVTTPPTVRVPAGGSASFRVRLKVDVTRLPVWNINGGSQGGNGERLRALEFDGYIDVSDALDDVHLPWHILPHRAAEVTPAATEVTLTDGTGSLVLDHTGGSRSGRVDVFSLTGTSGRIPPPRLPGPGDNFAVIDLKSVGARLVSIGGGAFGIQFAVNTFGTRGHPNYPAEFDVFIDNNRDGTFDFVVFNLENGGFAATGQNAVGVFNLQTETARLFFFTDADLNSANAILTAPLAALGLTPATTFDFSVFAFDNYFTGALTDAITGMTYTAGVPRYLGSGVPATGVPVGGSATLDIQAVAGGETASPSQTGLLLMYRDGRIQREADAITVTP